MDMTINCNISIRDPVRHVEYTGATSFASLEEFDKFKAPSSFFSSFLHLVVPLRTHTLKLFVRDMLFPETSYLLAIKCDSIAEKCFSILGIFFIEAIFLPVRLITALPRVYYNHITYKEPPIMTFLKKNKADKALLEAETLVVKFWDSKGPVFTYQLPFVPFARVVLDDKMYVNCFLKTQNSFNDFIDSSLEAIGEKMSKVSESGWLGTHYTVTNVEGKLIVTKKHWGVVTKYPIDNIGEIKKY